MADFDVRLGVSGVEFVPKSSKAWVWLYKGGKLNDLGSASALIRDDASAQVLAEELYRAGLSWKDGEAAAGRKALLPTPAEFASRIAEAGGQAPAPSTKGNKFVDDTRGCLLLLALPVIAAVLLLAYCSRGGDKPAPAPTPTVAIDPNKPEESEVVTECDMAVKASLVAASSYDPEFGWKYIAGSTNAEVLRHYDSTNGFGAKVTSIYDCKYDGVKKRIVSLQSANPYGVTTIIADPSEKPTHHHPKRRHHHKDD